MSVETTIQRIQNIRPFGQVVMIPKDELEAEVNIQAGKIARALLSKSMQTETARQAFLQKQIETILVQVGKLYECTEFMFVENGTTGFALTQ